MRTNLKYPNAAIIHIEWISTCSARYLLRCSAERICETPQDVREYVETHIAGRSQCLMNVILAHDWDVYFIHFDHHQLVWALDLVQGLLTDDEYWHYCRKAWIREEVSFPRKRIWLRCLRASRGGGARRLMTPEEAAQLDSLPEEFTVYRGVGRRKQRFGLSWTLSRDVAEQFANYSNGSRRLYFGLIPTGRYIVTARCPKRAALAYLSSAQEEEIVVPDPMMLSDVVTTRIGGLADNIRLAA